MSVSVSSAAVAKTDVAGASGLDVSVPSASVVKTPVVSAAAQDTDVGDGSGSKVCVESSAGVGDSGVSGASGGKSSIVGSAVTESDKGGVEVSVPSASVVKTLDMSTAVQDTDVGDGSDSKVCVESAGVSKAATASRKADETSGTESDGSVFLEYQGKSHNKRRQCLLCPFGGIHLARHLATTHPDQAESATERARLVYKTDEKARQRKGQKSTLMNPEERLYQCGLGNCCAIVSRMSKHLRRAHKISDPGKLAVAERSFQREDHPTQISSPPINVSLLSHCRLSW